MAGPLENLVVVDASQVMPGSIASMLLADHGADVIRVEPPQGTFFAHDLPRKSWERGKRSVTLDLPSRLTATPCAACWPRRTCSSIR